ncbi:hypothetical protein [Pseudomonas sp. 43(2021)]|uniref:hypothetical protein n=1 Tax=Pseudomonas sp. 43(2021) TaxID=2813560 RepID=UPI001FAEBB39|nr:hypothetical protein [Pseudomonas sp. 43(2021)]
MPKNNRKSLFKNTISMQEFGHKFIESLPSHLQNLKIPGRQLSIDHRRKPLLAKIEDIPAIQKAMIEVLNHPITQDSHHLTESAFQLFLEKKNTDIGVLKFFNGWNETHKTTSLVSAKVIMRLSNDTLSLPLEKQSGHCIVMAHMHEVAKDDFGLGHEGHDGMYPNMTGAFSATDWSQDRFSVKQCNDFSGFLYSVGVAGNKLPMNSIEYMQSMMNAMMVSIASELWNGREYNFLAQHIEDKLLAINPSLGSNTNDLRNAKGYVLSHSGEVENKHGLHALAAAQAYGRVTGLTFDPVRLQTIMLDYNQRVGKALYNLREVLSQIN